MKDRINFFNSVMSAHDAVNKKYNEKVADEILCNMYDFDVYYELYKELSERNIVSKPFKFIFIEDTNKIKKYTLKLKEKENTDKIYSLLKKKFKDVNTDYSTASVEYSKNSKKGIICIQVTTVDLNIDTGYKKEKVKGNN